MVSVSVVEYLFHVVLLVCLFAGCCLLCCCLGIVVLGHVGLVGLVDCAVLLDWLISDCCGWVAVGVGC